MRVRYLRIANFRGFEDLKLKPSGHVLLVGPPGAGRSDLVEALWRVLSADSGRFPLSDELDFHKRDVTKRIEIEVVLGHLGPHLRQTFVDRLELWDPDAGQIVEELNPGAAADKESFEEVVRFCYRAAWDGDQQQARQWVDFPKYSDPEGEDFRTVPRSLREELPIAFVVPGSTPLGLGPRGELRRLIDAGERADFSASVERLIEGIAQLAEDLIQSRDLTTALAQVLEPLRGPLGLGVRPASDVLRFAPEGGSLAGILRGLEPIMKLREELGFIPLGRHGSTLSGLIRLTQATSHKENAAPVVIVDDFGEGIDPDAAQHIATSLRARAAQLWLSTRRGTVGQCFRPEELVRLTASNEGVRQVHIGQAPAGRAERIAARHLHLQILPAISSKAVVIVEGPHDHAAFVATAAKLNADEAWPLLAAHRIALLHAGAVGGSGGIDGVPRLAFLARQLGFHVIVVIDWDHDLPKAEQRLQKNLAAAHAVIRWPEGHAIERVLLNGIDEEVVKTALSEVSVALHVPLDFDPASLSGNGLIGKAVKLLKSAGGLHGPFLDALPKGNEPPLLRSCLQEIPTALTKTGLVQL